MKIGKNRIIDLIVTATLALIGLIGYLLIEITETCNVFLVFYIGLNICLLPIFFYLMKKGIFPICTLVPLTFLLVLSDALNAFDGENQFFWTLVLLCQGIALVFAICSTIFIHSRKQLPQHTTQPALLTKTSSSSIFLKRFCWFIRDAILVFIIVFGIVEFSNVAFDTSSIVEFKATVTEVSVINKMHDRKLYIQYFGKDPNICITSVTVPKHIGETIEVGDEILLHYRKGYLNTPYAWVVE